MHARKGSAILLARKTKRSKRVEDPTGGNDGEVPPVPIPNTAVKLSSAESTWLDTAREDRSPPDSMSISNEMLFFVLFLHVLNDCR